MRSLARQQRAYHTVTSWSSALLKSAAQLSQGYPIDLRALGTLQAVAFSLGKSEAAHRALSRAIAAWVLSPESGAPLGVVNESERTPEELLDRMAKATRARYIAADAEAIAFADALKTMSKAIERVGP